MNLSKTRALTLLAVFAVVLGCMIYLAYPSSSQVTQSVSSEVSTSTTESLVHEISTSLISYSSTRSTCKQENCVEQTYVTTATTYLSDTSTNEYTLVNTAYRSFSRTDIVPLYSALGLSATDFDVAVGAVLLLLSFTTYWTIRIEKGPKRVVWHFSRQSTGGSQAVTMTIAGVSVEELLDPVTGVGFSAGEEIWQCTNCSSLYHVESHEFISEQNSSRCVVCNVQNQISRYRPGQVVTRPVTYEVARQFRPEIITIHDAQRNVGRIVSFEGRVVEVQRSQTSETYAVKFQRGRWVDVFKLVIFPQYVGNFGQGARTIKSYRGHTIRVRGLIQRHDTFGPQIIVNSEDMIEVLD